MRVTSFLVFFLAGLLVGGCRGGGSDTTPTALSPAEPRLTGVVVTGNGAFTAAGQTSQLVATATFSDGTNQVVTGLAAWQSLNPNLVLVSTTGRVTVVGNASGTTSVTASYQGMTGSRPIGVTISSPVPSLLGTWVGVSGLDPYYWYTMGPMYWVITQQDGLHFSGTFRIEDDLVVDFGVGTGTIEGTLVLRGNGYDVNFTAVLPRGQLPIWPDCTFELRGTATNLRGPVTPMTELRGLMDEWLCGVKTERSSNGFVVIRQ